MRHRPQGSGHPAWSVDPDSLLDLRRTRAAQALRQGEPGRALVEAEELLGVHPDDTDALAMVGEAALELGDSLLALRAYDGVVARSPDQAAAWIGLGLARLHEAEPQLAIEALGRGLELDDGQALGWYGLALARELLGQDSAEARERARSLDPARFPLPAAVDAATWEQAVRRARHGLPGPLRAFFRGVPLRRRDRPAVDALRERAPRVSPLVPALAVGQPPEGDPWTEQPEAVELYADNLAWPPCDAHALADRILHALVEVAGDWLGEDARLG